MELNYKEDWKFNKFADLLQIESYKKKIYEIYCQLNESKKKTLFILLNTEESFNIISKLLEEEGLLTYNALLQEIIVKQELDNISFKFKCLNSECGRKEVESKHFFYKKCPECESKVEFANRDLILKSFYILYINYFDFYLLNDEQKTCYIVRNKYNNKYFIKSSDESLINWFYIKLKENNCNLDLYLKAYSQGNMKKPTQILLNILKDNGLIKTIDNINFTPELISEFEDEGKTYFNIYSGNEYLNVNSYKKELDFKVECQNSYELLYNLTGKDEGGVDYILDVLALIVQQPQLKSKQLIIFYGEEAAGKGTFYDLILKPLFHGYITKILGKKLKSSFNGFMSRNLILVLEEVKADKDEEDTLKELVTEDKIYINPKNYAERYENNYLTVFGFSNEQNPISAGKRRGVYFRSRTLGGTTDKAPSYRKKYEKEIPKEFANLLQHLKTRKYDITEIMRGYNTEAKQQVINQNMSLIERFCEELFNYQKIGKYISSCITEGYLSSSYRFEKHVYNFNDINYIEAEFLLLLYNSYLKGNKYNSITLNRFSEFWQIMKIDKDNKKHWRRLLNPSNEKKTQYVNIDIIDKVIKKRYDTDE